MGIVLAAALAACGGSAAETTAGASTNERASAGGEGSSANTSDAPIDEVAAGNVVDVAQGDPELVAATGQAQSTLDEFIAALGAVDPSARGHAVKTTFRDGAIGEHMWVGQLRWDGERFHGVLDNDPVDVRNVRRGDAVVVERADVEDWLYFVGQEMRGGFTVRVLMERRARGE